MHRFYWIKQGLTYGAILLAASGLYPVYIATMDGFQRSLPEYLELTSMYLAAMTVIMPPVLGLIIYGTTIPLALSLGATRKEAWVGLQLYRLAMLLPVLGEITLFAVFETTIDFWLILVMLLSGYIFSGGLGGILGILTPKVSGASRIVVVCVIFIAGLSLAVAAVVFAVVIWEWVPALILFLPLTAALLYTLFTCCERKAIMALYVK